MTSSLRLDPTKQARHIAASLPQNGAATMLWKQSVPKTQPNAPLRSVFATPIAICSRSGHADWTT